MNRVYITLLSLFFVCTNHAMESMAVVSSAGSDAARENEPAEQERMVSTLRSLKNLAIAQVQRNVHRALKEDVELLKEDDQLTPENVEKNLINQIALLSVPDELKEKILQAYRDSPRWYAVSPSSFLLDHRNPSYCEYLRPERDDKTECVVFCNPNSDASQVAVIVEAWRGEWGGSRERLLYLWREAAEKWCKKLQQTVSESAEDVVWPSDNSLLVASKNDIAIFKREKDDDDFTLVHTVPISRYFDPDFNIRTMPAMGLSMEMLWRSIGRFSWNDDKKHLAVETEVDARRRKLIVASLKNDGSIERTQTLEVPISCDWGINSIEWDEDGAMHVLQAGPDKKNYLQVLVYNFNEEKSIYEFCQRSVFSVGTVQSVLKKQVSIAKSHDDIPYALSQAQRNSLRSMAPLLSGFRTVCIRMDVTCKHKPIAIREHPEEEFRVVGYRHEARSQFDKNCFRVWGAKPTLRKLCENICWEEDNKNDDPFLWRRHQKYEDI